MDSQTDSEALDNFFENDMILLSGGELDTGLLGPDLDVNFHKDVYNTKPFSILDELMASPPIHYSTNTTKFTKSSTISHPLFFMITTTSD